MPAPGVAHAQNARRPDDVLIIACTDPLAGIDIPNLLRQTGDTLEETRREAKTMTFRIRKR